MGWFDPDDQERPVTSLADLASFDLTNAVLLCSHHHHRVHDTGYRTDRLPNGDLRFHRRT